MYSHVQNVRQNHMFDLRFGTQVEMHEVKCVFDAKLSFYNQSIIKIDHTIIVLPPPQIITLKIGKWPAMRPVQKVYLCHIAKHTGLLEYRFQYTNTGDLNTSCWNFHKRMLEPFQITAQLFKTIIYLRLTNINGTRNCYTRGVKQYRSLKLTPKYDYIQITRALCFIFCGYGMGPGQHIHILVWYRILKD